MLLVTLIVSGCGYSRECSGSKGRHDNNDDDNSEYTGGEDTNYPIPFII